METPCTGLGSSLPPLFVAHLYIDALARRHHEARQFNTHHFLKHEATWNVMGQLLPGLPVRAAAPLTSDLLQETTGLSHVAQHASYSQQRHSAEALPRVHCHGVTMMVSASAND